MSCFVMRCHGPPRPSSCAPAEEGSPVPLPSKGGYGIHTSVSVGFVLHAPVRRPGPRAGVQPWFSRQPQAVRPALHRLRQHPEPWMDPRLRGGDESGRSAAWPGQRAHRAHFETRCVHPVAKRAGTLRRCHEVSCCVMRCHVPPRRALSADLLEAPVVCILHVVPPSRFVPFAPPPACLRRVPVSRVSHGRARPRSRRRGSRA